MLNPSKVLITKLKLPSSTDCNIHQYLSMRCCREKYLHINEVSNWERGMLLFNYRIMMVSGNALVLIHSISVVDRHMCLLAKVYRNESYHCYF